MFQESPRQPKLQFAQAPSWQTGYDYKLIELPKSTSVQTDCPVCLKILREPYQSSCCHNNFCQNCINAIREAEGSCPVCHKTFHDIRPNKEEQCLLKDLKVPCSHCTSGCKWTGKLSHYEQHLNLSSSPQSRIEGCAFVELECINGCENQFQRHLLDKHEKEECYLRPYSCVYCHEYSSSFAGVVYIHWTECKYFPVPCRQNCGLKSIERQNLKSHIDNECPLTVIKCEFHYAGCEELLPRKDMAAHLADAHEGRTPVIQDTSKQFVCLPIVICSHNIIMQLMPSGKQGK